MSTRNFNPRAREGRDLQFCFGIFSVPISIHAPARGATISRVTLLLDDEFQSTRPMRGATINQLRMAFQIQFQSTRPMRGATRLLILRSTQAVEFQSTRPMRGATVIVGAAAPTIFYFNPRAPCGARLTVRLNSFSSLMRFQSTRPMRGATNKIHHGNQSLTFQSTRPMRGATMSILPRAINDFRFQSTRPMRGATGDLCLHCPLCDISIHAPHAGRDVTPCAVAPDPTISIHAPHAGRDVLWDVRSFPRM